MRPPPDDRCFAWAHHTRAGVAACVRADIARFLAKSPEAFADGARFRNRLSAFLRPEIAALCVYRIAHCLELRGWPALATVLARVNYVLHKVSIPPHSCIGPGCRLSHPAGAVFDGRAGEGLTLFSLAVCAPQADGSGRPAGPGPRLGDRVTIGGHGVVLGPVTVGDDSIVAQTVPLDRDAPRRVLVVSRALRHAMSPREPARTA